MELVHNLSKESETQTDNNRIRVIESFTETFTLFKTLTVIPGKADMFVEKELLSRLINSIIQRIEYLEENDPQNDNLPTLKLLLADNVTKDGDINVRFSLLNKDSHLFFNNCTDYLNRYKYN